jgi:carboxypeptidase family protein
VHATIGMSVGYDQGKYLFFNTIPSLAGPVRRRGLAVGSLFLIQLAVLATVLTTCSVAADTKDSRRAPSVPGGTVVGGRITSADHRPAAGVTVEIQVSSTEWRQASTDANGRFEIAGLPPGGLRLVAYQRDGLQVGIKNLQSDGRTERTLDMVLESFPIRGRLVGKGGAPVGTGSISIAMLDGQMCPPSVAKLLSTAIATDGRFLVRLPRGKHEIHALTGRNLARLEVDVSKDGADIGDILVPESGPCGVVRDENGTAVPAAHVTLSSSERRRAEPVTTDAVSDNDGFFILRHTVRPTTRLTIRATGFVPLEGVEWIAGAACNEFTLRSAGSIVGRITDGEGRAIDLRTVTVQLIPANEASGSDFVHFEDVSSDAFRIEGLPAGTYTLRFTSPEGGHSLEGVTVHSGSETDTGVVRMLANGTLRGHVVVAASGLAVPAAAVRISSDENWGRVASGPLAFTNSAGEFAIEGLPPGLVSVRAFHERFGESEAVSVEIVDGRSAETVLRVTPTGRIEGSVRRLSAAPLTAAWITVSTTGTADASPTRTTVALREGRFVFDHVPRGGAALSLRTVESGRPEISMGKYVEVREGETTFVEFVVREVLVSGTITHNGAPFPGANVVARGLGAPSMTSGASGALGDRSPMAALSGPDGGFQMMVVERGPVVFSIRTDGRKWYPPRVVEISDAESQRVDLDFSGVAISGIVVAQGSRAAVAGATVVLRPVDPGRPFSAMVSTGTDGSFTMEVDPGRYRLATSAAAYERAEIDLEIGRTALGAIVVSLAPKE